METQIHMSEEVYEKIHYIMHNVDELLEGSEVASWLIGTWNVEDETIHAFITGIHIPEQEVSGAEVDISEDSQLATIRELGKESNKIIGHWHIHPFAKDKTSWSGTDETKIDEIMADREKFLFLLSSQTQLFGRVEYKAQVIINEERIKTRLYEDELEIETEKSSRYKEEIEQEIKKKVIQKRSKVLYQQKKKKKNKDDRLFTVIRANNKISIQLNYEFDIWGQVEEAVEKILGKAESTQYLTGKNAYIYLYTLTKETKKKISKVYDTLAELEAEYMYTADTTTFETVSPVLTEYLD